MNSFLIFYVIGKTKIDLFDIAHVKVELIPIMKIYTDRVGRIEPLAYLAF